MSVVNLPLYKKSLELCVYVEQIVKLFDRYTKYTIGNDLRVMSKEILFLLNRANLEPKMTKALKIKELVNSCEDMKMLLQLAKELKAFKNFKQFEISSKLSVEICKQSQAWLNSNIVPEL